jgi:tyrosyl-tRNA synthetase
MNQTTLEDLNQFNGTKTSLYYGYNASANSITIGNLAAVMMNKCSIRLGKTFIDIVSLEIKNSLVY